MISNSAPPDSTLSLVSPTVSPNLFREGNSLKLGILASGNGSNFETVALAIYQGQLNAQIQVLIYNNSSIKVAARAEKWSVPAVLRNH